MIYDSILEASSSDLISSHEAAKLISFISEKKKTDEFRGGDVMIFGKKTKIKNVISYYNDTMTEADAKRYMLKLRSSTSQIERSVLNYIKSNMKDFSEYDSTLPNVNDAIGLGFHVKPHYVMATKKTVVLMCTCKWDIEHGIGIQFIPSIKVAPQDIFL